MRHERAFTLVELLVVVAIIGTLVTIIVPVVMTHIDEAERTACLSNLAGIAKAMAANLPDAYGGSGGQMFPLLHAKGDPNLVDFDTGNDATALTCTNAMQNIWLLVANNYMDPNSFHCPADGGWSQRSSATKYGWSSSNNFSYGIQFPYPADQADTINLAPINGSLSRRVVIMADRNPNGAVNAGNPHSNHPGQGCAVMYSDSNVAFYDKPNDSLAGYSGDDIYTNQDGLAGGIPVDKSATGGLAGNKDTSLTPSPSR